MRGSRRASAKGDGEDYQRGEVLGEGRVSTVYLCLNKSSGQLVAMKQYSRRRFAQAAGAATAAEMASTDELYIDCGLRMRARIEEFRGLDNRHLVKYLGGERIDDTFCVYTEYVPGGSIASLLKRFGPLSEMVAHSYATQLFDGIEYLHTRKIVHGNITTRHILVASDGTIKLSGYASSFHRALTKVAKSEASGEAPGAAAVAAAGSSSLAGRSRSRDRLTGDVRSAAHVIVQMVTSVTTLRWTDALAVQLNEHNAPALAGHAAGRDAKPPAPELICLANLSVEAQRFLHAVLRPDATAAGMVQHAFLRGRCSPRRGTNSSAAALGGGGLGGGGATTSVGALMDAAAAGSPSPRERVVPGPFFISFVCSILLFAHLFFCLLFFCLRVPVPRLERRHTSRIGVTSLGSIGVNGTGGSGDAKATAQGGRSRGFDAVLQRAYSSSIIDNGSASASGRAMSGSGLPRIRSAAHADAAPTPTRGVSNIARQLSMSGGSGSPLAGRPRRAPSFGASSSVLLSRGDSSGALGGSSTLGGIGLDSYSSVTSSASRGGLGLGSGFKARPSIPMLDFGALRVEGGGLGSGSVDVDGVAAEEGGVAVPLDPTPVDQARAKAQSQFMSRFARKAKQSSPLSIAGRQQTSPEQQQQQHGDIAEEKLASSTPTWSNAGVATASTAADVRASASAAAAATPTRRKGKSRLSPLSVGRSVQWAVGHRGEGGAIGDSLIAIAAAASALPAAANASPPNSKREKAPLVMEGVGHSAEPHKKGVVNLFAGKKKRTLKQGRFLKSLGQADAAIDAAAAAVAEVGASPLSLAGSAYGPDAGLRTRERTPRNGGQRRTPKASLLLSAGSSNSVTPGSSVRRKKSVSFSSPSSELEPLPFPVGHPNYRDPALSVARAANGEVLDSRVARKVEDAGDSAATSAAGASRASSKVSAPLTAAQRDAAAKDDAMRLWLEMAGDEPLFLADSAKLVAQLWLRLARQSLDDKEPLDPNSSDPESDYPVSEDDDEDRANFFAASPGGRRAAAARAAVEELRVVTPPYLAKKPLGGLSVFFGAPEPEPTKAAVAPARAVTPPYLAFKPPGGLSIFFGNDVPAEVAPLAQAQAQAMAEEEVEPAQRVATPPYLAFKPPGGLSIFFGGGAPTAETETTVLDAPFEGSPSSAAGASGGFALEAREEAGASTAFASASAGEEEGEEELERCVAIAAYDGDDSEEGGELVLASGQSVWILEKDDSGWWRGVTEDGARGWFPSTYVDVPGGFDESASYADTNNSATGVENADVDIEGDLESSVLSHGDLEFGEAGFTRVWAIAEYVSQEEGELTFATGDLIWVLERDESGWWRGQRGGDSESGEAAEEGWFPSTYVEEEGAPDVDAFSEAPSVSEAGECVPFISFVCSICFISFVYSSILLLLYSTDASTPCIRRRSTRAECTTSRIRTSTARAAARATTTTTHRLRPLRCATLTTTPRRSRTGTTTRRSRRSFAPSRRTMRKRRRSCHSSKGSSSGSSSRQTAGGGTGGSESTWVLVRRRRKSTVSPLTRAQLRRTRALQLRRTRAERKRRPKGGSPIPSWFGLSSTTTRLRLRGKTGGVRTAPPAAAAMAPAAAAPPAAAACAR